MSVRNRQRLPARDIDPDAGLITDVLECSTLRNVRLTWLKLKEALPLGPMIEAIVEAGALIINVI